MAHIYEPDPAKSPERYRAAMQIIEHGTCMGIPCALVTGSVHECPWKVSNNGNGLRTCNSPIRIGGRELTHRILKKYLATYTPEEITEILL